MASPADTAWIIEQARAGGFSLCGIARAESYPEHARLPEWLACGYAGEMRYLADPRRNDPARILPGAKSAIVCALNYNTPRPYSTEVPVDSTDEAPCGWISRYAWGDDYHEVILTKLNDLIAALRERFTEPFEARAYVDTGPILERAFAHRAGLGWQGKNTCLINEALGSWLFLGVLVTTLELVPSLGPAEAPPPDLCGNCRLCLDACPTGALVEPYVLDASRCISYLTIELRGSIPEEFRAPMGRHVFGCDICQDVCPWNRSAPVTQLDSFHPRNISPTEQVPAEGGAATRVESVFQPHLEWLAALSEKEFRRVFRGSAIKRAKWRGIVRNACIALGNSSVQRGTATHARINVLLERLTASPDAAIAEHARWALARWCGESA